MPLPPETCSPLTGLSCDLRSKLCSSYVPHKPHPVAWQPPNHIPLLSYLGNGPATHLHNLGLHAPAYLFGQWPLPSCSFLQTTCLPPTAPEEISSSKWVTPQLLPPPLTGSSRSPSLTFKAPAVSHPNLLTWLVFLSIPPQHPKIHRDKLPSP